MPNDFEFTLKGVPELEAVFKELPFSVSNRIRKTAISKGASKMRTLVRRDAPRISGNLRRAIGVKRSRRHPNAWVGLNAKGRGTKVPYYYKTLDMKTKRGRPLHPWFYESVKRHTPTVSRLILEESKKALVYEAGKAFARQRRGL